MKIILTILVLSLLVQAQIPAENVNHQVTIKWGKPSSKYDGFHVYRADTCHDYIYLKSLGLVFTFRDTVNLGGETYKYKIRTILNNVESKDSNIVTVTIPY